MKQLIFTAHGTAQLKQGEKLLWSSDADEEFSELEPNEFLEPGEDGDEDMIVDYLLDCGLLKDDEEFDVVEETLQDLDPEGDDDDNDY